MPCVITDNCIACGDCEPECPRDAISEGPDIYEIDDTKCNDCVGYYKEPHCIDVCSEQDAIRYYPPQQ